MGGSGAAGVGDLGSLRGVVGGSLQGCDPYRGSCLGAAVPYVCLLALWSAVTLRSGQHSPAQPPASGQGGEMSQAVLTHTCVFLQLLASQQGCC